MVSSAGNLAEKKQPSLDIQFDRANKIYQPNEMVTGTIVLQDSDTQVAYNSIELEAEAYMDTVSLIRGKLGRKALPKAQRIYFMKKKETVKQSGIAFPGGEPVSFSFKMESTTNNPLIDSYVGVDFSIVFEVMVSLKRAGGNKPLPIDGEAKFDCRVPGGGIDPELGRGNKSQGYSITSESTPDDPKNKGKVIPRFNFSG